MTGSWWVRPEAQADRSVFDKEAAARETALRNDRRFGQPTTTVNVITAADERGMFAEYRTGNRSRRTSSVRKAGTTNGTGSKTNSVATHSTNAVSCIHGSAAQFIAAMQARANRASRTVSQPVTASPRAAQSAGETKMVTLKLKGTNKYATVYLIPGVPGQLMIRNLFAEGAQPPAELTLDLDPALFRQADPKFVEREEKRAKREENAEARATKAAERAQKAAERAAKAKELADRIKAKRAGAAQPAESETAEPVAAE